MPKFVKRIVVKGPDRHQTGEVMYWFLCPGCEEAHAFRVWPNDASRGWQVSGEGDALTFSPSLLCTSERRCHSFVRDGMIQFLGDCDHALAQQTIAIPEAPDWL